MRQVVQAISGGTPRVADVPPPRLRPGGALVRTAWSLVSAGTDRMVIDLAGRSLVGKARSRPDQVLRVLKKVRADGLGATYDAVRARLKGDIPLGYSASGTVVAVGAGVTDLAVGQEVACAGMGYASHAEEIFVPRNLIAPVPEGLDLRSASTVTLGAIAMQGFRRAEASLGERVGVVGLGFLGLLTVQILRSAGCRVMAVDLDRAKVALARRLGAEVAVPRDAEDIAEKARAFGGGHGLDAAIVTAATESSDPTVLAASLCRLGGRVVVVGAVGMDLPRRLFYDKELDLRLARSYGPGRYDPDYEERGLDYPYPWVRFTEGRNMEEYIALLGRGEVDVEPLLSREFGIEEGERAYRFLMSDEGRSAVGLLFRYPAADEEAPEPLRRTRLDLRPGVPRGGVGVALVGAGAFARSVLLPVLGRLPDFRPTGVATSSGVTAANAGRLAGFRYATTRVEDVLEDEATEAVVIATRHGDHADLACRALGAGKDVFVEKPLALSREELARVTRAVEASGRLLMVGFNRRFAPTYRALREAFQGRVGPLAMVYRVNAGPIPKEHWTRDLAEGGGRIPGEGCHFVDLMVHLAGAAPDRVFAEPLPEDGAVATLRFADGSTGTLVYATTGDPSTGKERLEVYGDETTAVLDGFRKLVVASSGRARRVRAAPGKGHREELRAFLDAVRSGGPSPVPYTQAAWSTLATLAIVESVGTGGPVRLSEA